MTRTIIFFSTTLLLLLGYLLVPPPLFAQSAPIALSITPAVSVAAINEKGPTRIAYTFRNDSTIDVQITPALHPFHIDAVTHEITVDSDQTVPFATTENTDLHLGQAFTLPAGDSKQIVLLLTPPAGVTRDIMLTLTGATTPQSTTTLAGSTNTTSLVIGAHLFLTTTHAPSLKSPLHLESVHISTLLDTFSPLNIQATVINDEQTLHQIKGTLRLQGPFTDELRSFSPDFIAANSNRSLLLLDPQTKVSGPLQFTGPFFPGKYTITTTLLEENGNPKHDVFILYVLPLRLTAMTAFALLLFGLMYRMKQKKEIKNTRKTRIQD